MTLLIQILTTLVLVIGIILGESISTKAFGMFKKTWFYLIEITFFVLILVLIFNSVSLTEYSEIATLLIYGISGFLTIIFVRGVMSGLGIFSKHVEKKVLRKKDEKDYIIGLKKSLERRGFEIEEIIKIAKETGFRKDIIDKVLTYFEIKPKLQKINKRKSRRKTY